MKKLKSKLLTYLFTDWVKTEEDVETLIMTRNMIEQRKNQIVGARPRRRPNLPNRAWVVASTVGQGRNYTFGFYSKATTPYFLFKYLTPF